MAKAFLAQEALEKAVLFRLFDYAQEEEEEIESSDIRRGMHESISLKRLEMALQELSNRRMVTVSPGSEYAPTTYTISRQGYMQVENELKGPESFTSQFALHGDDFLLRHTVGLVPAADRMVSRHDNQPLIVELEEKFKELSSGIEASNSIGEEIEEPKEAALGEIDASLALIKREHFSLRKLVDLVVPLLRKLAEKFASAAIGKLAAALIEALLKL